MNLTELSNRSMYKLLKQDLETVLRTVAASHSILGTTKKLKDFKKKLFLSQRDSSAGKDTC